MAERSYSFIFGNYRFKWGGVISFICFNFLLIIIEGSATVHAEGLQYERLRIRPQLAVEEYYSDNVFQTYQNEEGEFFTVISPQLALDFAFAPRNFITIEYIGQFYEYSTYDNFADSHQMGRASWNLETRKGSLVELGASTAADSVQPYGPNDTYEGYRRNRAYGTGRLAIGRVTDLGLGFEWMKREFDNEDLAVDNYDRLRGDIGMIYRRSEVFPLLLQYRIIKQDNENLNGVNRDWVSQSVFTGADWRGSGKMSGALRIGYTATDFEEDNIEDVTDLGMDIDMTYAYSDITRIQLTGERLVEPVTTTQRERGNYYILTSGGVRLIHNRWERITTELGYRYFYREYQISPSQERIDREHLASVSLRYDFRRWLGILLGYQYRDYDSDDLTVSYEENLAHIGIYLSI